MAGEGQHQSEDEDEDHHADDHEVRQRDLDESPLEVGRRSVHVSPLDHVSGGGRVDARPRGRAAGSTAAVRLVPTVTGMVRVGENGVGPPAD